VLGKLFVQNYRILSKTEGYVILYKRINSITHYLFAILDDSKKQLDRQIKAKECMDIIKKFSPDKPNNITLLFIHLHSYSTTFTTSDDLQSLKIEHYRINEVEKDFSM
jgi:hypothetical protein